jgi:hypothetical protein
VASSTPEGWEWQGTTWTDISASLSNIPALVDAFRDDLGVAFADVDGDGYADIIKGKQGAYHEVWFHGSTTAATSLTNIPSLVDTNQNDLGVRFGDFNGDGHVDYLMSNSTSTYLYLNKADGTGWIDPVQVTGLPGFIDASANDAGARVMDVNGDDVDDIVKYKTGDAGPTIYVNNGDGVHWTTETSGVSGVPLIVGTTSANIGTRIAGIDGDGLPDFIVSTP